MPPINPTATEFVPKSIVDKESREMVNGIGKMVLGMSEGRSVEAHDGMGGDCLLYLGSRRRGREGTGMEGRKDGE